MRQQKNKHKGVVLIAVLVVVAILSLAAYQYSDLTMAEFKASDSARRQTQARALAESGVNYAAAIICNPDNIASILNGNLYHNETAFAGVKVAAGPKGFPGSFTLLAPADPSDGTTNVRHGVTDETGKINLNALMQMDTTGQVAHDVLLKLPNMTEEIASAIVDWIDADSQPRTGGAEDDYYTGLNPPYRAKNGPLESIEELLLVKGVTPQLLFGKDKNRNGLLDAGEDNDSGTLDRGWSAFLTIHSREQLLDATGQPLIDVNGADLAALYQSLSPAVGEDLAKYIVIYRLNGALSSLKSASSKQGGSSSGTSQQNGKSPKGSKGGKSSGPASVPGDLANLAVEALNLTKKANGKVKNFFDLVNSQVSVPGKDAKSPAVVYTSPLKDAGNSRTMLPLLFAKTKLHSENEIPARINVNTAPAEVLTAIPDIVDADVQTILSMRPRLSGAEPPQDIFRTPAWLYTEANLKADALQKLEKYVTTRAQVFRVQVVGVLDGPGPSARVEAVIDTAAGKPRIVTLRDLSELGRGWNAGAR